MVQKILIKCLAENSFFFLLQSNEFSFCIMVSVWDDQIMRKEKFDDERKGDFLSCSFYREIAMGRKILFLLNFHLKVFVSE
jgi:hypothetical protein